MLMEHYRAIEAASAQMLAAARCQDWQKMLEQQEACAVHIEQLRNCAARGVELDTTQRNERSRIMQRILANDAQIRLLTEPWMAQIAYLLGDKNGALH